MADFKEYVAQAKQLLVLATSVDNQPSARIVGFGQDLEQPSRFYIVSKPDAAKIDQIKANPKVAFTTLPGEGGKRMSSNRATARISERTWPEIEALFADNPGWHSGHPHPETETIIELTFDSVLLDSFVEAPESVTFD
ncbi:putative pyridoxamine 5'-phosphate oxidase family protein [Weissella uvarum]|uniref:pyridoxamine 5'-phosphate oxidase family protein n=1 Tax=Weissella uvarum TaxID=1479233 RepID=UPI00196021D3|nr:pyridoxamine 5'-phosphate oxidase family protein [Weissella uvarum]MBM7616827.1 putative pyridoxamine 5'-phosphate oxidase family protein [Weissella uvarum]MCM0594721.1 pyridoxamine 5'-phosphate oxidase family protein [Weissella uvarum]